MPCTRIPHSSNLSPNNLFFKFITTIVKAFSKLNPHPQPKPEPVVKTDGALRERLGKSAHEIDRLTQQLKESQEETRKSAGFFQTILDNLTDDMIVLDQSYHIIQVNRSLSKKYNQGKIIGKYCYEVTHRSPLPCQSPSCSCPLAQVLKMGTPSRVIHVHPARHNLTHEKYVEVSAFPLFDSKGQVTLIVEVMRDITEIKEQERQIVDLNRRLVALNTITGTLNQSLSFDFTLHSALEYALAQVSAEVGGILLIDEKTNMLSYKVNKGFSKGYGKGIGYLSIGEGIAGTVAKNGETLVIDDVSKNKRASRAVVVSEEGLSAFIAVPLKSKDKTVGVLIAAYREPRLFLKQEVQVLESLSHELGIAIENARLYQELQLKEKTHAEMIRKLILTQEEERRQIARNLHDVTSQVLATMSVQLEAIIASPQPDRADLESKLSRLKPLIAQSSKEVHRLIQDLRPSLLDDLGLVAAIRSSARNDLEKAGIETCVEITGRERRLLATTEITIFRIVQEALTNIIRHAQAESAFIGLAFRKTGVCVQVEDDGIGFDQAQAFGQRGETGGMGILGMRERVAILGGTLVIKSEKGKGSMVVLEIPDEKLQHV